MKKRILALTLSLALIFALASPALAAVDWSEVRITMLPEKLTIKHGESFTLRVEVDAPAGVEVAYQWKFDGFPIENATTNELHIDPDSPFYPAYDRLGGTFEAYVCRVTACETENPENVQELYGSAAYVYTERTAQGKIYDVTIGPFIYAFDQTVDMIAATVGLLLPVSPFLFLKFLFESFAKGFRGISP